MIIFGHRPQVDLNFYLIVTMKKFAIESTASKDVVEILIDDLEMSQDDLSEARDKINNFFEDLKKDQDALATGKGGIDVDGSEILDINAGGVVMSVTKDTLTHIKGKRLEALFSGSWDRHLTRDNNGKVFLDINSKYFWVVAD